MARGSELWDRFETALATQDYDGLVSLFAPEGVYIEPAGRHEGREAIRAWLDDWGHAFSDIHYEAILVIEEDEVIVAETTYRSTHTGPLTMPDGSVVPATGKTVDTPGVTILRVKDGRIVDARDYVDMLAGMIHLGLLPGV
jgi:steroid delta-isomerase-like uncharacterized protein